MLPKHLIILNLPSVAVCIPYWIDAFLLLCASALWGRGGVGVHMDLQAWLLSLWYSGQSPLGHPWASSPSKMVNLWAVNVLLFLYCYFYRCPHLPSSFSHLHLVTPTLEVAKVQNLKSHLCNEFQLSSLVLCCLPAASQALLVSELMRISPLIFVLMYMHISHLPLHPSSLFPPFLLFFLSPSLFFPLPFLPPPCISSFCESAGEKGGEIAVWASPAILKLEVNGFSFSLKSRLFCMCSIFPSECLSVYYHHTCIANSYLSSRFLPLPCSLPWSPRQS